MNSGPDNLRDHVLCHNAGIGGPGDPPWETTDKDRKWLMSDNFDGILYGRSPMIRCATIAYAISRHTFHFSILTAYKASSSWKYRVFVTRGLTVYAQHLKTTLPHWAM